jgi:hypothetical protein
LGNLDVQGWQDTDSRPSISFTLSVTESTQHEPFGAEGENRGAAFNGEKQKKFQAVMSPSSARYSLCKM